jgi:4-hydroxy-4-methyl-2-oxoglutarate aldolase
VKPAGVTPVVVTGPPRTPSALVARLGGYGVATVHEALGRRGLLGADLRPAWPGARAAGTAVTALCLPGDNLTVHVAVELTGPGDVLVVTTTEPSLAGYIGELLTTSLAARGVTGLVTTTGIRDVTEIAAAGFPAWSRAVNAQGTVKGAVGQVNRPVVIGGTTVGPGDAIVADADGVVCVPRAEAADVLAACELRERRESVAREKYRGGRLSLDVNDLRALVADLGVEYVPWAEDERSGPGRRVGG